jgi:inner membrane protein
VLALLTALMGFGTYRMFFSLHRSIEESATDDFSSVRLKDWSLMYFMAFLTHWLIDTCTAYGTQIFEPFSNYRVAFNNISIVDPIYTVPFILGLSIIAFIRTPKLRQRVNTAVLAFTTLYLAFTFFAKSTVNKVFAENIDAQGIKALKYTTYPSLGNTILWQTTVETDSAFYYGMYSLLDKKKEIDFVKLPKNHDLLAKVDTHEYVEILKWFAQGYYNVIRRPDGRLQFNNLRFGLMSTDPSVPYDRRFVFKFIIEEKDGKVDVIEDRDMSSIPINKLFAQLFTRIKGVE